jgi:hypothetical protein
MTLITLPLGRTGSQPVLQNVRVAKSELRQMTTEVPQGVWGGPHIIMEVTTTGASITYDCALGAIDQKITLDSKSRFDVRGTHTRLHPGPTRSDETPDRHPARYTGHVGGKNMTLMLELTDTKEKVGTFSLKLGEQPELTRCF